MSKIETILDIWYNGQKKQFIAQVRVYGVKRFFIDIWAIERVSADTYIILNQYYYNYA